MHYRDILGEATANDDVDLIQRYRHFNDLLFDGKLPEIPVIWASLKNVGGVAEGKSRRDPSKPEPSRLAIRYGRADKRAHHTLVADSIRIRISSLYKRSALAIDKILIHEMIHVLMFTTGHLGEGHGNLFKAELRRCSKIVGYEIPMKDRVEDAELADNVKIRPFGVILIERRSGYQYVMVPATVVETALEEISDRLEYFVKYKYFIRVWVYVISDQMWSEQSKKTTVQRSFGSKTKYSSISNQVAIDDLHQNGRLLFTT